MGHLIAPSVLSADFNNLGRDIEMLNNSEADWIHCDVMDGNFVPNISFGFPIISAISKVAKKPLDVHLMVHKPENFINQCADSGASLVTVHQEVSPHADRVIHQIKEQGMRAGIVLNPSTSIENIRDLIPILDLVLLMSVNPGFGGQKFIERIVQKTARLKNLMNEVNHHPLIEIDGGVNLQTGKRLIDAGADVLVAGSFIFKSPRPETTISELKSIKKGGISV